jgi:hypothetical protein
VNLETLLTIAAIAWPLAVWALRYPDSVLLMIWREGRTLTWHYETLIIGVVSACLVIASGAGALQWMAWAGGMAGHGSSSVGRRMYEAQARAAAGGSKPDVHCWRAQREYSYTGRMWFAAVNLALAWYGALASIALGAIFDQWREWYARRRRPLPLHVGDCPMTNSLPSERSRCVCASYPDDVHRDYLEGGGGHRAAEAAVAKLIVGHSMGLTPAEAAKIPVITTAPVLARSMHEEFEEHYRKFQQSRGGTPAVDGERVENLLGAGRVPAAEFAADLGRIRDGRLTTEEALAAIDRLEGRMLTLAEDARRRARTIRPAHYELEPAGEEWLASDTVNGGLATGPTPEAALRKLIERRAVSS